MRYIDEEKVKDMEADMLAVHEENINLKIINNELHFKNISLEIENESLKQKLMMQTGRVNL